MCVCVCGPWLEQASANNHFINFFGEGQYVLRLEVSFTFSPGFESGPLSGDGSPPRCLEGGGEQKSPSQNHGSQERLPERN